MTVEKRDGILWADLFWVDLSEKAQAELLALMGDNGNFDVFPIASINISPDEEATLYIHAELKEHGWIDGTIDCFRFQAKVYDVGSKFGINNGRVSKLSVWEPATSVDIFNYDRGWDKKPANDEQETLLQELLGYLEDLPSGEQ